MSALQAMSRVTLRVAQKAHPHVDADFICTGEPITLPSGVTGFVMRSTRNRVLVQYGTGEASRFGWTDAENLESEGE